MIESSLDLCRAYAYIATNCSIAPMPDNCKLHVVFHGCEQTLDSTISFGVPFNDTYVRNTGYNGWAETNNICWRKRNSQHKTQ